MINREALEGALKICNENKQLFADIGISDFNRVCYEVNRLLYAFKLREDYGISCVRPDMVQHLEPNVCVRINDNMYVVSMGEKYNRTISWSVDGRQPEDEIMLVISFPTGAYIFGDSYPEELFERMWTEIKSYNPKYTDDMNKTVYFPLDKAAPIANEFRNILNKYYKIYKEETNLRKVNELRRELERLEGTLEDGDA